MTDQALIDRIDARIAAFRAAGYPLSRTSASELAGMSKDGIRNLGRKDGREPLPHNLAAIAEVLQCDPLWLLTGKGEPPAPPLAPPGPASAPAPSLVIDLSRPPRPLKSEVEAANVRIPLAGEMPRDLPIYGTAAGSLLGDPKLSDPLELDGVADYVRRPAALLGSKTAYGLYITGESMEPAFHPGDLVVVHPQRPIRVGDIVIIQTRLFETAPMQAFIKRLVRRTEEFLIVEQYNPHSTIKIKQSTVLAVHRVLTMAEVLAG